MTPTLHFAGGTDEIGASSLILDLGRERLIIDAGLRHKAREGSHTPAWTPLSERPPTAIVLTHAHLDHTGALPALHRRYPHLSIYATRATYKLISLMLEDSLKIMSLELKEGEEATLASALKRRSLSTTPLLSSSPPPLSSQLRLKRLISLSPLTQRPLKSVLLQLRRFNR